MQKLVLVLLLFSISCSSREVPSLLKVRSGAETIPSFQIERFQLPNGIEVMVAPDSEVPLVSGTLYMVGGTIGEDEREPGVVSAMGHQLRSGGAGRFSAEALDEELEGLAARVGSAFGAEYGTVTFSCLKEDLDTVFAIFSDVIFRPRFEEERLELWKGSSIENIKRRKDDGLGVANLGFTQVLYEGTPFGRVLGSTDIRNIKRARLLKAYKNFVRPNGATLAFGGNIDVETVRKLVQGEFSKWEKHPDVFRPIPAITKEPQPAIYFVSLPFTQSSVMMGHLGVGRFPPDYVAIELFSDIFGSGNMGSRLMRKVRTELGLAYSVYGGVFPGLVRGKNFISFQTKSESTADAIREVYSVLEEMQRAAVASWEIEEAKYAVQNSFVFGFTNPAQVADRRITQKLLSYPEDFDQTYVSKVLNGSVEDIKRVANERWDLSKFVIVVVGDETALSTVQALMKNPPEYLKQHKLKQVKFDEKLVF